MVPQEEASNKGGFAGAAATGAANNGLPRPQSSLELLSQTASVMEHSPQSSFPHSTSQISIADLNYKVGASSSSNNLIGAGSNCTSPKEAARGVTPTDLMAKRAPPPIPDMSKKQPQPVFLEQKRGSFLPAPLLGEAGPESNIAEVGEGRAGTPLYYSPGLFLTYSNGSTANGPNGGWNNNNNTGHQSGSQIPPVASATSSGSSEGGGGEAAVPVPNFLTSHGSFTSSGSLVSAPYAFVGGSSASLSAMPPAAAFVPPPSQLKQGNNSMMASDDAQRENLFLRQQMAAKDATIDSLQKQVEMLQNEIRELRQLPTGKISQIPVEDMLSLMREYGSEVSDTAMPPRKTNVQKASVVRQFRRWNPNFLDWFTFRNGHWVPKLGKEGELQRREESRRQAAEERRKKALEKQGSDGSVHTVSKKPF